MVAPSAATLALRAATTNDTFAQMALSNVTLYNISSLFAIETGSPHGRHERNYGSIHFWHRACITQTKNGGEYLLVANRHPCA